jgi:hypothetical protein
MTDPAGNNPLAAREYIVFAGLLKFRPASTALTHLRSATVARDLELLVLV